MEPAFLRQSFDDNFTDPSTVEVITPAGRSWDPNRPYAQFGFESRPFLAGAASVYIGGYAYSADHAAPLVRMDLSDMSNPSAVTDRNFGAISYKHFLYGFTDPETFFSFAIGCGYTATEGCKVIRFDQDFTSVRELALDSQRIGAGGGFAHDGLGYLLELWYNDEEGVIEGHNMVRFSLQRFEFERRDPIVVVDDGDRFSEAFTDGEHGFLIPHPNACITKVIRFNLDDSLSGQTSLDLSLYRANMPAVGHIFAARDHIYLLPNLRQCDSSSQNREVQSFMITRVHRRLFTLDSVETRDLGSLSMYAGPERSEQRIFECFTDGTYGYAVGGSRVVRFSL